MFKITHTNKAVFGDEKFDNCYRDSLGVVMHETTTDAEYNKCFENLKEKCVHKFRCLDDDGEWYFRGVSTSDSSFAPLDSVGAAYGCTMIEYMNKNGEWELL